MEYSSGIGMTSIIEQLRPCRDPVEELINDNYNTGLTLLFQGATAVVTVTYVQLSSFKA
jgi:hypothetical protein